MGQILNSQIGCKYLNWAMKLREEAWKKEKLEFSSLYITSLEIIKKILKIERGLEGV